MTLKRMVATVIGAFLVSQALAILVHGFLLARDYAPFYGNLLRSPARVAWQALFLPVSHLCFCSALLWVYLHVRIEGSRTIQGLKLGLLGWIVAQVPLYLIWYAEQPWPGALVVKQLGFELASSLIIGITISGIARCSSAQATRSLAGTSSA